MPDNAIADAVTEFERQRDHRISDEKPEGMNIRLGLLAHGLSTLTTNAMLAVAAIKKGTVGVGRSHRALVVEVDRQILGGAGESASKRLHVHQTSRPDLAEGLLGRRSHTDRRGGRVRRPHRFRRQRIDVPTIQAGARRGRGLGSWLIISRRGVEANGGRLRVRNRAGVGCVFTIDLPQAPPR